MKAGAAFAVACILVSVVAGCSAKSTEKPADSGAASGMPGVLQAAAATSEFVGGAALILGLLTPLASLGLAGTMAAAIGMVHVPKGDPFVSPPGWKGGSWELAAVYLAAVVLLLLAGPGRLSLDALLFGKRAGSSPEVEKPSIPVA